MLTEKQKKLFDFIKAYLDEHGYGPSFEEMMAAIGAASKSNVHRFLECLKERGYIVRIKGRARAITIVESPSLLDQKIKSDPSYFLREAWGYASNEQKHRFVDWFTEN